MGIFEPAMSVYQRMCPTNFKRCRSCPWTAPRAKFNSTPLHLPSQKERRGVQLPVPITFKGWTVKLPWLGPTSERGVQLRGSRHPKFHTLRNLIHHFGTENKYSICWVGLHSQFFCGKMKGLRLGSPDPKNVKNAWWWPIVGKGDNTKHMARPCHQITHFF